MWVSKTSLASQSSVLRGWSSLLGGCYDPYPRCLVGAGVCLVVALGLWSLGRVMELTDRQYRLRAARGVLCRLWVAQRMPTFEHAQAHNVSKREYAWACKKGTTINLVPTINRLYQTIYGGE